MKPLTLFTLTLILISAVLTSCQTNKVSSKGHLFILSGQSNMLGLDPELSFAPMLRKHFGVNNVTIAKYAKGGQPIRRWDKGWKPTEGQNIAEIGDLYNVLMQKVKKVSKGKQFDSITFVWMQGERDAREGLGDLYKDSFYRVLNQISLDTNSNDINFVIGRLSDFDMKNVRYPDWTKVRQIQTAIADASDRGAWVNTDKFNDGMTKSGKLYVNDLHYTEQGYVDFGAFLAQQSIKLIEKHTRSQWF